MTNSYMIFETITNNQLDTINSLIEKRFKAIEMDCFFINAVTDTIDSEE